MISIILPVYNQVTWVEKSIQSILRQTHHDYELIIVDDGSTDGSTEMLQKYADIYSKISYYRKENGGTGSALNLGFSHAKGEYGTWISGDNTYEDTMLSELYTILKNQPSCKLVFSAFKLDLVQDPDKKTLYKNKNSMSYYIPNASTGVLDDFIQRSATRCITGICYLFDMNLKRECGDYVECPGEDYLMGVIMGLKTQVYYLKQILGVWYGHPDCITVKSRSNFNLLVDPLLKITVNQMVQNLLNIGNIQGDHKCVDG